jgi:hypothetical protein
MLLYPIFPLSCNSKALLGVLRKPLILSYIHLYIWQPKLVDHFVICWWGRFTLNSVTDFDFCFPNFEHNLHASLTKKFWKLWCIKYMNIELQGIILYVDSKGLWQCCITLRIMAFLDFVHCLLFWSVENTTFRKNRFVGVSHPPEDGNRSSFQKMDKDQKPNKYE